jgi:restriction system protein
LLQTFVILGGKVKDGDLIEAVNIPWFEIVGMLQRDPSLAYQLEPRKWEEMIAAWYKQASFDEVILTPRSGDGGKDVIAFRRGSITIGIYDQVKRYKPGHLVTADEVRAFLHVVANTRNISKGIVTTTSDFAPGIATDDTIAPYVPNRLQLVNGTELNTRLAEVAAGRNPFGP